MSRPYGLTDEQADQLTDLITELETCPPADWDFRYTQTCAIGMLNRKGIDAADIVFGLGEHGQQPFVPVRYDDGMQIDIAPGYGVPATSVTPQMVADKLKAIVAGL